jgi:hypothetical protein
MQIERSKKMTDGKSKSIKTWCSLLFNFSTKLRTLPSAIQTSPVPGWKHYLQPSRVTSSRLRTLPSAIQASPVPSSEHYLQQSRRHLFQVENITFNLPDITSSRLRTLPSSTQTSPLPGWEHYFQPSRRHLFQVENITFNHPEVTDGSHGRLNLGWSSSYFTALFQINCQLTFEEDLEWLIDKNL